MSKRKETEAFILSMIAKTTKNKDNLKLYEDLFAKMNNNEFDQFMRDLRDDKVRLHLIVPQGSEKDITVENNIKVAKSLGYDFFKKVKITGHPDKPDHILPNKYLFLKLPISRLSQSLEKKVSFPKGDSKVDVLTGQVSGEARGASVSKQELEILVGGGYKRSAVEFFSFRGGDLGAKDELNNLLYKTGVARQQDVMMKSTGVESTKTLNIFFLAAHLRSTLLK